MKLKSLMVLGALALASVMARATDVTQTFDLYLPTTGVDVLDRQFFVSNQTFVDTYNLNLASGVGDITASFTTLAFNFSNLVGVDLVAALYTSPTSGSTWTKVGSSGTSFDDVVLQADQLYKLVVTGITTGAYGGAYTLSYYAEAPVPEPASLALFAAGVGALLLARQRRRKAEEGAGREVLV